MKEVVKEQVEDFVLWLLLQVAHFLLHIDFIFFFFCSLSHMQRYIKNIYSLSELRLLKLSEEEEEMEEELPSYLAVFLSLSSSE